MYYSRLTQTGFVDKNKAQTAFKLALKKYDGCLIANEDVAQFKKIMRLEIEKVNLQHKGCKPLDFTDFELPFYKGIVIGVLRVGIVDLLPIKTNFAQKCTIKPPNYPTIFELTELKNEVIKGLTKAQHVLTSHEAAMQEQGANAMMLKVNKLFIEKEANNEK